MKTIAPVVLILFAIVSCNFGTNTSGEGEIITEGVRGFTEDNPVLLESIKQTRDSLPNFITSFKNNTDSDTWYMGKFEIYEGDLEEHIWIEILEIEGAESVGLIANDPYSFKTLKYLDTVNFDIEKAEDIIILKRDSIIFGNYLERLLTSEQE